MSTRPALLMTPQAIRNRVKHAENLARAAAGLPPLDRQHGRPALMTLRVYVIRHVVHGIVGFDANAREPGGARTFLGRFPEREQAAAAAARYAESGIRQVRARKKPGQAPKPRPPRNKCTTPPAIIARPDRMAMLRAAYRATR